MTRCDTAGVLRTPSERVGECKVLAKYCNSAPMDGSAPNLVQMARDKNDVMQMQRAFNTQVNFLLIF